MAGLETDVKGSMHNARLCRRGFASNSRTVRIARLGLDKPRGMKRDGVLTSRGAAYPTLWLLDRQVPRRKRHLIGHLLRNRVHGSSRCFRSELMAVVRSASRYGRRPASLSSPVCSCGDYPGVLYLELWANQLFSLLTNCTGWLEWPLRWLWKCVEGPNCVAT